MNKTTIIAYSRTPIGSFLGSLSSIAAPKLASFCIKSLIEKTNIDTSTIDEVILGNVLSAGIGQAPSRQAAIFANLPTQVECLTINKVCGSGLKAVMLADQSIRSGYSHLVVSGGMENMSQAPYYVTDIRRGKKLGHAKSIDGLVHDGLWDPYNSMHMGSCAEVLSEEKNYTKAQQDGYAIESYKRAQDALRSGVFKNEIVAVEVPQRGGKIKHVLEDEEPGRVDFDKVKTLKAAFKSDGTISAANASTLNDGAAALLVSSLEYNKRYSMEPLAEIVAHCSFAHDPLKFTTAPSGAIKKVLKASGMTASDVDLFEINEAFSNVAMSTIDDFNLDPAKVNVFGGAVSLGHPIGASGARILCTLLTALETKNKEIGLATLCIGGGEAAAILVRRL